MNFRRALALCCLAGGLSLAMAAEAQPRDTDIPAEFPPESFEGRQYVDSRGCVYVRAGVDGSTEWVPRVTRSREHICGQTPTGAGGPMPSAGEERLRDAERITLGPDVAPPPPRARPVPAAAAAPVRAQPSKPPVAPAPRIVRPVPQTVADRAPPPSAPAPRAYTVRGTAPLCSATEGPHGANYTLRCVPNTSDSAVIRRSARQGTVTAASDTLPGTTRILPRHVWESRDEQVLRIPDGYRPAWEDDRLNRHRANMSIDGYMQTQRVWTNTVPRRLVNAETPRIRRPKIVEP
ncbi:hypothetical protein [Roseivivax isoporae]|uniref:Sporulation protein n=1 Tax=Roseivivax isoporae LMG 25204 TaxID=1449351 RepID=X7F671_9RHOB|nr:hypothetical protein [Roseivivax isoporae]ETX27571.1 hypothetical protein RISW2_13100 [Roseivivax isoporae LMG 25204]